MAALMVERLAAAFKNCDLDCYCWTDDALNELAEVAIKAMRGGGTVGMFMALYDSDPVKPVGEKWDAAMDALLVPPGPTDRAYQRST